MNSFDEDPLTPNNRGSELDSWADDPDGTFRLDEFGTLIDVEDDHLFPDEAA